MKWRRGVQSAGEMRGLSGRKRGLLIERERKRGFDRAGEKKWVLIERERKRDLSGRRDELGDYYSNKLIPFSPFFSILFRGCLICIYFVT